MNSRITIEIDFDNKNEPILKIHYKQSDDVRDKLLKSLLEKLSGEMSYLEVAKVYYPDEPNYGAESVWILRGQPEWIHKLELEK
jgi:hypothetical protein